MKAQHVRLKDLPPRFDEAGTGEVVRIAELQSQGYLYLHPWGRSRSPAVQASPQGAFGMPLGVGSDRSILGSIHYEWRYPCCEGIVIVGSIDNRDCSAECWNREKASQRT
ncbi:MAG TPA: hypothetical protein VFR21_12735 [Bradyrhizobium sp.]|jgi:hypothetical protein|nr:hypothetical protein [Bradyrhizobium sp.]